MVLAKKQVEKLDPEDPWLRDELGRRKVAEYLTPVLASIRQPFVISLHAPYGTGKSFFLECWKADLEQQGYKVVLFDAWATDFSNDPLSAFIASLKKQTEAEGEEMSRRFVTLAKKSAGFLRSKALPLVFKGLGRKLLGEEGVQEVIKDFNLEEEEVANALCSVAVEALSAQEAAEKSMEDFRDYLAEIAAALVGGQEGENQDGIVVDQGEEDKKKLIIFVDELDRCKPSYAIAILEAIKHLFAVEGTVFVLAFDEDQMLETISSTYGLSTSGEGYLRKFIDWRFELPVPNVRKYCDFLAETMLGDVAGKLKRDIAEGITVAATVRKMSLRQVEQAFSYANLVIRSATSDEVSKFAFAFGIFAGLFAWCQSYLHTISRDIKEVQQFANDVARECEPDHSLANRKLCFTPYLPVYFISEALVNRIRHARRKPEELTLSENDQIALGLIDEQVAGNFDGLTQRTSWPLKTGTVADYAYTLLSGADRYLR